METEMRMKGKTPTHAEVLKALKDEWRWQRHCMRVSEREMEIRKQRFEEVEQDALKQLGDKFLNENQIIWEEE